MHWQSRALKVCLQFQCAIIPELCASLLTSFVIKGTFIVLSMLLMVSRCNVINVVNKRRRGDRDRDSKSPG